MANEHRIGSDRLPEPRTPRTSYFLAVLGAILAALALAACGSTKVYTADKTLVYQGSIYNLGNVQQVTPGIEGRLPDGNVVDLRGKDRKAIEALLKEQAPVEVTTMVMFDERSMVYQRAPVSRYPDYSKMVSRFEGAMKDISKFMADKKKTQLKLK